jgi:hypothetical protein
MMIPDDGNALAALITEANGLAGIRQIADEVMGLADVNKQRKSLVLGNHVNPFFVPHANGSQQPQLNAFQLQFFISQLRMSAANSSTARVVVSAPMKSGSTFISESIGAAFHLPKISLMMLLARPYDYAELGAASHAHEIDELALLNACLVPTGFVAHHHMLCTPFLTKQAELYNLKFILLRRNIFDCLISLDDFCLKLLTGLTGVGRYLELQLPLNWVEMEFDDRMHQLLNRFLPSYVQYYVSWKLLERGGAISPLWLSYEDELLGDKAKLAGRICDWLGRGKDDFESLVDTLKRGKDLKGVHFNKGVAGRGAVVQGANRQRVVDAFGDYKDLADWSEILD